MKHILSISLKFLVFGLVISCKSIITTEINSNNPVLLEETSCGSFAVKNKQEVIGYYVKPFFVNVDSNREITEFERNLKLEFKNKFNKYYRAYSFTTNRAGDTILGVSFLSSSQIQNIAKWKCELLDVDSYPKRSDWVDYNCSKNRFKIPGDPD